MFRKTNSDWQIINDDISHIQHKKKHFKKNKLLTLLSVFILFISALGVGGYFFINSVVKALNFSNFITPDIDIKDIDLKVNMALVPITSSEKNLRLVYFEDTLKNKAFNFLKKQSWWKFIFSTNPDDFNFSWYKPNTSEVLTVNEIAKDGFHKCDLKLNVKHSNYNFYIHIGAYIYNTSKFYENFMIFNHFESKCKDLSSNSKEMVLKGYLSKSFSVKNNSLQPHNLDIYKWIEDRISIFSNNEKQELFSFDNDLVMYPILTSISDLKDIDLNNPESLENYLPLLTDTSNYYYDKGGQYKKLNSHSTFSIIYSPIPNLIDQIKSIVKNPNIDNLETYLKQLNLAFTPFVEDNQAIDYDNHVTTYSTIHNIIKSGNNSSLETQELTKYFCYATNTINIDDFRININKDEFSNIATLNKYIKNKLWKLIYNNFKDCEDFVSLKYPNPDSKSSFSSITKSLSTFQDYFYDAFANDSDTIGKIIYYDAQNNILNFSVNDLIPLEKIKHFSFGFGPEIVTESPYDSQSFSLFFKTFWV